jgi:hypothetical protein
VNARSLALVVGITVVAAVTVYRLEEIGNHRRSEIMRLERIRSERSRLNAENASLESWLALNADAAALRTQLAGVAAARARVDALLLRERELKRLLGQAVDPVWPANAEVLGASAWTYAGQASPSAALESVLSTARSGDVDKLAKLIDFEGDAGTRAQALFDGLPEESRAQYGSPAKVMAVLIAARMPSDYVAMATLGEEHDSEDTAVVGIRLQDGSGGQRDLSFKFQKHQNDWRLDVPEPVVESLAHQLKYVVRPSPM